MLHATRQQAVPTPIETQSNRSADRHKIGDKIGDEIRNTRNRMVDHIRDRNRDQTVDRDGATCSPDRALTGFDCPEPCPSGCVDSTASGTEAWPYDPPAPTDLPKLPEYPGEANVRPEPIRDTEQLLAETTARTAMTYGSIGPRITGLLIDLIA